MVATADHNTPTTDWNEGIAGVRDPFARLQIEWIEAGHRRDQRAAHEDGHSGRGQQHQPQAHGRKVADADHVPPRLRRMRKFDTVRR